MAHSPEKEQLLEDLVVVDRGDPLPLHAQVRRALTLVIQEGFQHGDRFFNEEFLSARLGVSLATVRRALTDLASKGALDRYPGKGTFVRKAGPRGDEALHLGVFVPGSSWSTGAAVVDAVLESLDALCSDHDYLMHVSYTHGDAKTIDPLWQTGGAGHREGFILLCNPPDTALELHQVLAARGLPSVNVGTLMDDYPGTYVGVNNGLGIRLALEHLTALRHRRIVLLVNESLDRACIRHRMQSFATVIEQSGLDEARVVVCDKKATHEAADPTGPPDDVDDAVIDSVLNASWAPTAIVAASDPAAWAILKRLADRGVKVPEQVSVLGFGDEGPSRFVCPPLSTIALPYRQMAERAIALLLAPGDCPTQEHLPPALLVRQSTGPAPPR